MRGVCAPCHAKLTRLERERRRDHGADTELSSAPAPARIHRRPRIYEGAISGLSYPRVYDVINSETCEVRRT
jgi:hypothetical protein